MPASARGIAALLLNVLVWPGLGSIVGGAPVGWAQGTLFLLAMVLLVAPLRQGGEAGVATLVVLAAALALWAWSLATAIRLLREDGPATAPARGASARP